MINLVCTHCTKVKAPYLHRVSMFTPTNWLPLKHMYLVNQNGVG